MLKVFANLYANDVECLNEIKATLEKDGFEIAYNNGELNAVIIKEVENLHESETSES